MSSQLHCLEAETSAFFDVNTVTSKLVKVLTTLVILHLKPCVMLHNSASDIVTPGCHYYIAADPPLSVM